MARNQGPPIGLRCDRNLEAVAPFREPGTHRLTSRPTGTVPAVAKRAPRPHIYGPWLRPRKRIPEPFSRAEPEFRRILNRERGVSPDAEMTSRRRPPNGHKRTPARIHSRSRGPDSLIVWAKSHAGTRRSSRWWRT